MESSKRFLVHFIKKFKYLDFCLAELESLSDMHGIKKDQLYVEPRDTLNVQKNPLVYVNMPNEEVAKKIVDRAILIKEVIDVISEATSYQGLLDNVDKSRLLPILEEGKTFRFNIEAVGRKIQPKEQVKIIESFGIFPFTKNIDLKNP